MPEVIREVIESYGWTAAECRPAIPDSAAISRMDLTYRWLSYVPDHRRVMRRIVACRSLVSPVTGKHIIPWRRLGEICRADYRAVQRWHHQGIGLIVQGILSGSRPK
jgi:hypothetical protein